MKLKPGPALRDSGWPHNGLSNLSLLNLTVLEEARHQARMLSQWKVAKVKRECNLVANDLANLARRNTHTAVWLGRAPACVEDTLRKIVTLVTS